MIELCLHDDRPDINPDVENDDGVETDLGTTALAETLHVENESKAETSNANKKKININRF